MIRKRARSIAEKLLLEKTVLMQLGRSITKARRWYRRPDFGSRWDIPKAHHSFVTISPTTINSMHAPIRCHSSKCSSMQFNAVQCSRSVNCVTNMQAMFGLKY